MNDYKFGNFLYELRMAKGLSQAQLGAMLGVSNKAVSKWESGVAKPQTATLFALAKILDITAEELLAGERTKQTVVSAPSFVPAVASAPVPSAASHLTFLRQKYRRTKRAASVIGWVLLGVLLQIFVVTGILVGLNASENVGGLYAGLTVLALLGTLITWIVLRVSSASQKRLLQRMGEDVTEWKMPIVAEAAKPAKELAEPPCPTPQEVSHASDDPIRAYQRALCDRVRIGLVLYAVPVWLTVVLVTLTAFPISQLLAWLYLTIVYLPLMLLFSVAAIVWTVVAIILTQRRKKQLLLQYPNEWEKAMIFPKKTRTFDIGIGFWGAFGILMLLMQSSMGLFWLGALLFTLAWVYFFVRFTKMRP